jgi:LytS/YehU family sensor histidine kinase
MRGIKHTITGLLMNLLNWYFDATMQLLKIRAVTAYVKAVAAARLVFIGLIALKCLLLLMFAGFILAHIGLFLYLPCRMEHKALGLFILGLVYFLVPLVIILIMCSQKRWMKYSKASELVRKVATES